MPPPLVVGEELPKHPQYDADQRARKFWRLSYRAGRDYVHGQDASGHPIIYAHEREHGDSYERRKRTTKPRGYVGPIIRRYNDFVARHRAERPAGGELYETLLSDTDGHGTPLHVFMVRRLLRAQVDRESYILPTSNRPAGGEMLTQAQARAQGIRPLLKPIDADSVVWWREHDGVLDEAIVLLHDSAGALFARWMGPSSQIDISVRMHEEAQALIVTEIGEEVMHPFGGVQLVRLRPVLDDDEHSAGESQASPLAESQQAIINYISLLNEEIFNVTFSQMVATGVAAEDIGDVNVGNNRLIAIPNPNASLHTIGADPAQAQSIRMQIEDETREVFRQAGVASEDPLSGPGAAESGIAKAFRFNDLAANLAALADAAEEAENLAIERLFRASGQTPPGPVKWPDDFDLADFSSELEDVIRVTAVRSLPPLIRRKSIDRFVSRNFELSEEERADLDEQLDDLETTAAASQRPPPFDDGV